MKKLCVSLLLIVLLAACDPADPVSGPDTPTPDTSAPVSDPMSGPDTPAPPLLSLSTDMAAQYTIVYDDSDAAVVTMFEEFAASLRFKLKAELPLIPASEAETDYGHEIVLGNARPAAADVTDTLTKNDFASAVRDGDWFLCASDPIQYRYLFRVVSDRILTRNSKGVYTVNEDILFSESDLSETSIAEYLRKKSSALSPTVIRSITQACTYTAQDGTELLYRFYLPSDYTEDKEYPVVVFLHGAGDRGNDNDKQLSDMIDTLFNLGPSPYLDAILIIPQCPKEAVGQHPLEQGQLLGRQRPRIRAAQSGYGIARHGGSDLFRGQIAGIRHGRFDGRFRHVGPLDASSRPLCGGYAAVRRRRSRDGASGQRYPDLHFPRLGGYHRPRERHARHGRCGAGGGRQGAAL